ncbi:MAG: amidohydrolase, partial [Bryobacteraceae bacterium]
MINRREFLASTVAAARAANVAAQPAPSWGGKVLDIHHHFRSTPNGNLQHMDGCGVTNAVLLTNAAAEEKAKAEVESHPGRFIRFTSANVTKPESFEVLRNSVKSGGKGFGEIKFHVALDGPEMKRLYALAAELNVPVLIHFQEVEYVPGGSGFNIGFSRLPSVLKEFPRTTFIGHADYFWANISADPVLGTAYPTGKIKPGGLTDRMLSDYANLYGDTSANSGRNAMTRDPDFIAGFLQRHKDKLMFGSDCSCTDGRGTGQGSKEPALQGKCVARETLTALKHSASPDV